MSTGFYYGEVIIYYTRHYITNREPDVIDAQDPIQISEIAAQATFSVTYTRVVSSYLSL